MGTVDFEILQIAPAPPGWAIRWRFETLDCWDWPMAVALYECRSDTSSARRVGPVDSEGELGPEQAEYYCFEFVGDTLPPDRPHRGSIKHAA